MYSFPGQEFLYDQKYYRWDQLLSEGKNLIPDQGFAEFCIDWAKGKKLFKQKTSGSTGKPKIIQLKRDHMEISARLTIQHLGLNHNYRSLICLDANYIAGKMMIVRSFLAGMMIEAQTPGSNPLMSLVDGGDQYFTALVPMQMHSIVKKYGLNHPLYNRIGRVIIGGAPVNYQLQEIILQLPFPVYLTYGMTETVSHIALRRLNGPERSGLFELLPGVKIDQDQENRLMIKSEVTDNQWLVTNDLVEIKDQNHFKWIGRKDNIINSGGVKINPEPVENELARLFHHFGIMRNFFLTGIPDQKFGEKLVLIMEGEPLNLEVEGLLKEELEDLFDSFHQPKNFIYLAKFQRTETGKIIRRI